METEYFIKALSLTLNYFQYIKFANDSPSIKSFIINATLNYLYNNMETEYLIKALSLT